MRRLILLAVICLASYRAEAWNMHLVHGCNALDGLYMTASIGVANPMAAFKSSTRVFYIDPDAALNQLVPVMREDLYRVRAWGDAAIGWGWMVYRGLYLGGRFGLSFSPSNLKSDHSLRYVDNGEVYQSGIARNSRIRLSAVEYTLDIRPGWVWCGRSMLYGLVGIVFADLELTTKSAFSYLNPAPLVSANSIAVAQEQKDRIGLHVGFGFEQMLTDCVSFIASYTYAYYGSIQAQSRATVTSDATIPNGLQGSSGARVYRQVASMGLGVHF